MEGRTVRQDLRAHILVLIVAALSFSMGAYSFAQNSDERVASGSRFYQQDPVAPQGPSEVGTVGGPGGTQTYPQMPQAPAAEAPSESGAVPTDRIRRISELIGQENTVTETSAVQKADQPEVVDRVDVIQADERSEANAVGKEGIGESGKLLSANRISRLPGNVSGSTIDPPGGGVTSWIMSTLTSLGVVIAVILGIRWAYMKMGGKGVSRSTPVIEMLSRTAVAPKNHVVMLRVGGRILICSDSSAGMRTLTEITDPEEVAELLASVSASSQQSVTRAFQNVLGKYGEDYDQSGRLSGEEGGDVNEYQTDRARESVTTLLGKVRAMAGAGKGDDR
ncbi:FliO/MopB family protein [Poriferisphaera sp. WC338]|uniref:FliO/MopB family protein n=1 Tax=Poriferisphaera sp. WC338 TaxID=3425129 RepID=UPI003D81A94D